MARPQEEDAGERAPLFDASSPSYTAARGDNNPEVTTRASWLPSSQKPTITSAISAMLASFIVVGVFLAALSLGDGETSKQYDKPPPPLVNLTYTSYEGIRLSNGVNAFLGMRYAAPPLGDLRWRAPVEPKRRTETDTVEKADRFGPICLRAGVSSPLPGQDEDCLFVNVWAPANATEKSKLPVWVFIGGGGYNALTNANWNGSEVVEKSGHNIVMLDFNYRVGMWGFLASERLRSDGALNVGLLDQRMLLTWVKKHISAFGGDPNHVVIHGASAGAGSVVMHLLAYGGRNDNLFVGAMSESLFFPAQPYLHELEYQFDRLVQQAGCSDVKPEDQLGCLRSQNVTTLQAANRAQHFPGREDDGPLLPIFYWTPCVDGDFLPDLPYRLMRDGRFLKEVSILFGTNTDEGSVFAYNSSTPSDFVNFFAANYPKLTPSDTARILSLYSSLPLSPLPNHNPWFPHTSLAYGEATFICPSINFLDAFVSCSSLSPFPLLPKPKIFSYRFNLHSHTLSSLGLGVPHLFDAAAIFGPDSIDPLTFGGAGGADSSYKTYNKPIVSMFMAYWISFVRGLDPNVFREGGSPVWEEWGEWVQEEDREGKGDGNWSINGKGKGRKHIRNRLLVELNKTRMEQVAEEESGRCRFWEEALGDRLEQFRG
ncbi:alpha/beta-hydrolase [Sordaria brevicollis]|uniref:Carboxylic ester hydrolase n=1 Tax=Sordaria brevicollis TaxID=83679 RepID=A0AAE0PAT0_SORBR|nr:alpha/beta-hydrolase [Sordaria brevicollis]